MFAHDEALKFLEQARESAEALHRADDLHAIDEEIGDIHEARGTTASRCRELRARARGRDRPAARAALNAKIGTAYCNVGDPRGLPYLEEALVTLDPATQTNELAVATASMGRYYHYRTEHNKAIEFLERARELAEPLDDPGTLGLVYSFLAGAHQHLLQYDESDRWARVSIAMGERKGFPARRSRWATNSCRRTRPAEAMWDQAIAFAAQQPRRGRKAGSLARVAWSGFCRACRACTAKASWLPPRKASREAWNCAEQIGEERLATWLGPMAAVVAADLGDDDAARAYAERGWARAQQLDQLMLSAWALNATRLTAAHAARRLGAARGWYEQYVALVRDTENGVARHLIMARAAEGFLRAGRLDDAESLAVEAAKLAEFAGAPHYRALARSIQAEIQGTRREYEESLRSFDDAIALFAPLGSRLELTRAGFRRAELLIDRANPEDLDAARAEVARARAAFAEMGALHDRALADERLKG